MPYETDERLKSYLDSNQLQRERLCLSVLANDKRFTDARPRHPRGGPDGGRDIEATFRGDQLAYGAVGFVNQATDSKEHKKTISKKFAEDLKSAVSANRKPEAFIFFTNINLTVKEREGLTEKARKKSIGHCEIFDRERIRIALDEPDGFSIRFQYLNIPLSEAEQATFFARWGDDIQSVIATGFQRVESTLNRVLFFQEASDPLVHLTCSFQLDRKYTAEEIGHFRAFFLLHLKEPKHKILSILFGCSDKSDRTNIDHPNAAGSQPSGIKFGISGGQWESYFDPESAGNTGSNHEAETEPIQRYKQVGSSSSVGLEQLEFLAISYSKDGLIRFFPEICLRDLDQGMFLPIMNKKFAEKVKVIHIFANGYKIQEIGEGGHKIDRSSFGTSHIPVPFSDDELADPWVRLRPSTLASAFRFRFFEKTPKRMYVPELVGDSLEEGGT